MSMLSIHVDDLESMRTKLLSAVVTGEFQQGEIGHARAAALHLKRLAVLIENRGTTFITSSPHALGDLLEDAIQQTESPSSN